MSIWAAMACFLWGAVAGVALGEWVAYHRYIKRRLEEDGEKKGTDDCR